jgi:hypothetical protein
VVREVLQRLKSPRKPGVALLEPKGFGASWIIDDVVGHLRRTGGRLLPVQLTPDRRSVTADKLFSRLLSDLQTGLKEEIDVSSADSWMAAFDFGLDGPSDERFEAVVERLMLGPVKAEGRTLILVVDGLARVQGSQLLQTMSFLLGRLSKKGLKLLVWGGEELHELQTRPPERNEFSAFHELYSIRLGPLSAEEVAELARQRLSGARPAGTDELYEQTCGHPALVYELLEHSLDDVRARDKAAMEERLLGGVHVTMIRRAIKGDHEAVNLLRKLGARGDNGLWGIEDRAVDRLEWLGVLRRDDGAGEWRWAAPVMRRLAEECRSLGGGEKVGAPSRKVFISYSHKDVRWLQRLDDHLKSVARGQSLDIWDDRRIAAGNLWREEIERALDAACAAVLLVSSGFLASDFIMVHELPALLSAAEERGLRVVPIILSPCPFEQTRELSRFQAVNSPSRPLSRMSRHEAEEVLLAAALAIASITQEPG